MVDYVAPSVQEPRPSVINMLVKKRYTLNSMVARVRVYLHFLRFGVLFSRVVFRYFHWHVQVGA